MPRTILVLLSEYGYWGEELVGPLFHFDKAGYGVVFATPNGNRAHVLPPSIDPAYVDPPLGRTVTSHEVADLARILDESDRLDNPLSLAGWIPERPYTSAPNYLRETRAPRSISRRSRGSVRYPSGCPPRQDAGMRRRCGIRHRRARPTGVRSRFTTTPTTNTGGQRRRGRRASLRDVGKWRAAPFAYSVRWWGQGAAPGGGRPPTARCGRPDGPSAGPAGATRRPGAGTSSS